MICIHCGENILDESLICVFCGKKTDYPSRYNYIPSKVPAIQNVMSFKPEEGTSETIPFSSASNDESKDAVRENNIRADITSFSESR